MDLGSKHLPLVVVAWSHETPAGPRFSGSHHRILGGRRAIGSLADGSIGLEPSIRIRRPGHRDSVVPAPGLGLAAAHEAPGAGALNLRGFGR